TREQRFRHYLAAFGIEVPPRALGERDKSDAELATTLERIAREKRKRASIVHVWAPPPPPDSTVPAAVRKLRVRHVDVRWTMPAFEPGLERVGVRRRTVAKTVEDVVLDAVRWRVRASQSRAERAMRALGIRARHDGRRTWTRVTLASVRPADPATERAPTSA